MFNTLVLAKKNKKAHGVTVVSATMSRLSKAALDAAADETGISASDILECALIDLFAKEGGERYMLAAESYLKKVDEDTEPMPI